MKLPIDVIDGLNSSAKMIFKKVAEGTPLTENELMFLGFYTAQLRNLQRRPMLDKILDGAEKVMGFMNKNLPDDNGKDDTITEEDDNYV